MNHKEEAAKLELGAQLHLDFLTGELVGGAYRLVAKGVLIIEE